ncbi:methyltransferase [Streptomyces sp. NPDC101455]|uniref:SAM-dependent methyltransferase n=1 Tax=Streptomyces sp. NPDC101455 TaxID=3366142 RepID=UPI0038189B6B
MTEQDAVLTKFREYILGPLRFMNVLSCFELGIIDALREEPAAGMTAERIAKATGLRVGAVEQMLLLPVKEGLVDHNEESEVYRLSGIARVQDGDLARVLPWMDMMKEVCLRQLYWLTESVRSGKVVGLKELYDFDGNFYEASTHYPHLQKAWGGMMDSVTGFIDPWFHEHLDVPQNARVLDIAGNTGLGAVLAVEHKREENISVTCFDFAQKEAEARETFRAHGVEDRCSFIGGDVFQAVPTGFDVVMIKHFLDMFDKENVHRILTNVYEALGVGGQIVVLSPVHPEDITQSSSVDFFPAYFYGCTMAEGGPQKVSTYAKWMTDCGFEVTKVVSQDIATMPADMIPAHGLICGTKTRP